MKESIEPLPSRLEDQNFFSQVQEAVAERLDELVTDPTLDRAGFQLDLGDKIRNGEKIPPSRMIRDAVTGVGEDFRLTRDEIDVILEKFLEKYEP